MSGDGRYVFFESTASNLVTSDPNGSSCSFFRKGLDTDVIGIVGWDDANNQVCRLASSQSVSDDGRWIVLSGGWLVDVVNGVSTRLTAPL